ncbi:hypothetical protein [Roseicella frigidaeris]|uniref:hypothetical protein n=1 Tax=Roseicella frigidaeris TaxID=2230885 RepID=UPI000FDF14B3|nr:hypothetical protein [Roseicella frigidaeris]
MASSDYRWRINSRPRFTVLEMGEYMAADDGPRETMLRDMRFERLSRTLIYRFLRPAVTRFLTSPTRDRGILHRCRATLEHEIAAASNPQQRENLTYELRALQAFEGSLNALEMAGLNFEPAQAAPPLRIEGVTVSVQPTAHIRVRRPRGTDLAGAIVVDVAKGIALKSDEAVARRSDGMRHAAVLVHEYVAGALGPDGAKPSPDHSIIFHSHRQERVCAPSGYRRMLRNVEAACRNIARSWEGIQPPANFDLNLARTRR